MSPSTPEQAAIPHDLLRRIGTFLVIDPYPAFRLRTRPTWTLILESASFQAMLNSLQRTAEIARRTGDQTLWTILLEDLGPSIPRYRAWDASPDAMSALYDELGLFQYLIVPESLRWGVICSTNDFYLAFGEPHLVEPIADTTAEQAIMAFEAILPVYRQLPAIYDSLSSVLRSVQVYLQHTDDDRWVDFHQEYA